MVNNISSNYKLNENEFNLGELFKTLLHYKRSILLVSFLTLLMGALSFYFKTPVYSSSALIEVKSDSKEGDLLGNAFASLGNEKVDKDIEILKTFKIHNQAINKVNFHTRYFINKGFKRVELYDRVPIKIKNTTIVNNKIVGSSIKLVPVKDGYHLQVENTFKNKMLHSLFNKDIIELDEQKIYHYGEPIKNEYFELTIEKKDTIDEPIYFVLLTNNRNIYGNIKNNLQIRQLNKSTPLIQVTYKDTIPKRADAYLKAVIESFILQSVAEKTRENDRIINFIDSQMDNIKTKVDNSEKKLENYRIENKAIDPSLQGATYISELSRIDIELSQNELKEMLMKNLLSFIEKGKNLDAMAPLLMELNDSSTLALITTLQEAQIKEEGLKAEYSSKHPGLLAVRKQIRYIIKKLILNVQNLKSSMSHRNANLAKLKKAYDKNIESLPTQERMLINLRRDYEASAETYKYLLQKKSENEMIKVAILSDYRIIDSAYNNGQPIGSKPRFILLAALILGMILGVFQALFRNFMNKKIQSRKDIESLTTLPIYGVLPALKQK